MKLFNFFKKRKTTSRYLTMCPELEKELSKFFSENDVPLLEFLKSDDNYKVEYKYPKFLAFTEKLYKKSKEYAIIYLIITIQNFAALLFIPINYFFFIVLASAFAWSSLTIYVYIDYKKCKKLHSKLKEEREPMPYKQRNYEG